MRDKLILVKCSKDYVVVNANGERANHGHFKKRCTANKLIKLIQKQIVPDSSYLRESVLRITLNRKYKERVEMKIRKDSNKLKYFNVNCGVVMK